MTGRNIIKVEKWMYDKINDVAHSYRIYLRGAYEDGMLDHTTLYVENVINETEKAVQVALDAETADGRVAAWKTWIPKSAILSVVE